MARVGRNTEIIGLQRLLAAETFRVALRFVTNCEVGTRPSSPKRQTSARIVAVVMHSIDPQKLSEPTLGHPRFPEAQRTYIDAFPGYYLADPFLIRHLIDAGSLTLAMLLVGFHAAHDERDRTTWEPPAACRNCSPEAVSPARAVSTISSAASVTPGW